MHIRMKSNLARRGELVPAFSGFVHPDQGVDEIYLSADDLIGSVLCESNPNFNRVKLRTGIIYYMRDADLEKS